MDKSKFFTVIGTLILFFWLSSFAFNSLFSDLFGRIIDLLIVLYVVLVNIFYKLWNKKFNLKIFIIYFLYFSLIIFSIFRDLISNWINSYSFELYFKTIFYSMLAFSFARCLSYILKLQSDLVNTHLKYFAFLTCGFSLFFFLYFLKNGWHVGESLIYSNYANYYQGLSRVFGLFLIIIFFLREYLNFVLFILSLSLCLILIFSFNSFGVFFSIIVIAVYLFSNIFKFKNFIIIFSCLFFIVNSTLFFSDSKLMNDLLNRAISKMEEGNTEDGRYWLVMQAYELWTSNLYNMLIGAGPIHYASKVGFSSSYRHPHNSIMLLLIWFGVLSLPYIIIIVFSFLKVLNTYIKSTNTVNLLISSLLLYYLLLSLIGSDIEQNRHLLFLIPLFYDISKRSGKNL